MNEAELRAAFEAPEALTIGLEEEAMLLDPVTLDLAPIAAEIVGAAAPPSPGGSVAVAAPVATKLELPASQGELVAAPARNVSAAIAALAAGRRALAETTRGVALPAVAGTHPFAAPLGMLNSGPRYDAILREYGDVARAQLVCSLQVHVAVGGADRTLAVYNALRGHVPELAALAANAPFHAGRDTGMASVRPLIGTMLPRQGVPPEIPSWEHFEDTMAWGITSGAAPEPRRWWWELRPHVAYGTLEIRVCD